MRIKKGDTVKILKGKDRGKTGKVIKVDERNERLTVEGINLYKKHVRPKRQGEKGEIIEVSRPFAASKAMIICPSCGKSTRVGYRRSEGEKSRYCKKCNAFM